jgi:transmembrane sensor
MSKENFESLFQKYLYKTCSPDERDEFLRMAGMEENQLLLSSLGEKYLLQRNPDIQVKDESAAQILEAILKGAENPVTAPVHDLRKRWLVAAAAVLILFGAGYYYFLTHTSQGEIQPQAVRFKNDVLPGGNRAMLTLSNGAKIMLDSARTGLMAREKNSNIIKTDSGQLKYLTDSKKSGSSAIAFNTLSTPRGGQYRLQLPDGTRVWLNAASSITYPTTFNGNDRTVEITGEAYFEVAHNSTKPFRVKARGELIEDLGTHFNINAYSDEPVIRTTLLEGSVKVSTTKSSITLLPGSAALEENNTLLILNNVNTEESVAWKNGYFQIDNAGIETIMKQVARWYDVDVDYQGTINKKFNVLGVPRSVTADQMFRILELTGNVHFKMEGKKVTVMP